MGRTCEGLLRKGVGERLGWGTEGARDKGRGGYCWRLGGFRRKEGSGGTMWEWRSDLGVQRAGPPGDKSRQREARVGPWREGGAWHMVVGEE